MPKKKSLSEEIAEIVRVAKSDRKKGRHKRGDQKKRKGNK